MWMVYAAGPAAGMIVPRMAILAVAVIGMFVAMMLLVMGMSRRGTQPYPGHRIRARTRHNRTGARRPAAPLSLRSAAQRPPAAPLSLRPSAQRPSANPRSLRPSAHASEDRADRAGSLGYGPPSRWGDVPEDPYGWR
jgi:hypothetical protein